MEAEQRERGRKLEGGNNRRAKENPQSLPLSNDLRRMFMNVSQEGKDDVDDLRYILV